MHDLLTISRAAFDFVDAIERVTDPATVIELFDGELKRYGFHAWLITGLPNHGERIDPLMMLNGWPKGWTETYTRLNLVQNDPVVAHCFRSTAPFVWRDAPYDPLTNPKAKEVMERATDFRMNEGFCVPIHSSEGFQAVVTMAGEQVEAARQVRRALHLMALYAYGKAVELCLPKKFPEPRLLTKREREVLQWTAAGKTAWEIGAILHISERTVNFHLQNLMGKLGVHNKTHAAAKAMTFGLIQA